VAALAALQLAAVCWCCTAGCNCFAPVASDLPGSMQAAAQALCSRRTDFISRAHWFPAAAPAGVARRQEQLQKVCGRREAVGKA
jgi:hypothetical protein